MLDDTLCAKASFEHFKQSHWEYGNTATARPPRCSCTMPPWRQKLALRHSRLGFARFAKLGRSILLEILLLYLVLVGPLLDCMLRSCWVTLVPGYTSNCQWSWPLRRLAQGHRKGLDELVHVDQNCVPQEPQILSALKLLSRDFAGSNWARRMEEIERIYRSLVNRPSF